MTRGQRSRKAWTKWRKVVSEQARSGQSVAAFCRERGLCAPQFFAWRKRLDQAEAEKVFDRQGEKFVEVKLAASVPEVRAPEARADQWKLHQAARITSLQNTASPAS